MAEPRDPRIDPQPGDVLRNSIDATVEILAINEESALTSFAFNGSRNCFTFPIEALRKWARAATVEVPHA